MEWQPEKNVVPYEMPALHAFLRYHFSHNLFTLYSALYITLCQEAV